MQRQPLGLRGVLHLTSDTERRRSPDRKYIRQVRVSQPDRTILDARVLLRLRQHAQHSSS